MSEQSQDEVVRFLSEGGWDEGGAGVECVRTHISLVFLGSGRALKLKRAVRLPYLDFTTLERRRAACESELATNRRTAPGIYRGMIAITREAGGGLALNGSGETVDWVVDMVRFREEDVLLRMAERGALETTLVERLADEVAAFHAGAARCFAFGGRDSFAHIVANNRATFDRLPGDILDAERVAALFARIEAVIEGRGKLLDERRRQGFVRHGHGDLHLANICVFEGRPTPFDAIEFSLEFANIDVLYDVAFLLMDLVFRGLEGHANRVLNRYLDRTGDAFGLAALPLFLAVRAVVRSHVAGLSGDGAAARAYFTLAERCLTAEEPFLVAIGGLSGTGKSSVARELALLARLPVAGPRIVRSDTIRKRLAGVAPEVRLGPQGYTDDMGRRTYETIVEEAAAALRAGRPVIADAVFAREEERAAIEAAARQAGAPFLGVWLEAPLPVRLERIGGRTGDASDAGAAVARAQEAYDPGPLSWRRVDARHGCTEIANLINKLLH